MLIHTVMMSTVAFIALIVRMGSNCEKLLGFAVHLYNRLMKLHLTSEIRCVITYVEMSLVLLYIYGRAIS